MDELSVQISEYELKKLREKAQAWDIAWPALIFLDAMGALDGHLPNQTLKDAVKYYNSQRNNESV